MIYCFVTRRFSFSLSNFWLLSYRHWTWCDKTLTHASFWIKLTDNLETFSMTLFFSWHISPNFLFSFYSLLFSLLTSKRKCFQLQRNIFWCHGLFRESLVNRAAMKTPSYASSPALPPCVRALPFVWLILQPLDTPSSIDVSTVCVIPALSWDVASLLGDQSLPFVMVFLDWFRCHFFDFMIVDYLNFVLLSTVWRF